MPAGGASCAVRSGGRHRAAGRRARGRLRRRRRAARGRPARRSSRRQPTPSQTRRASTSSTTSSTPPSGGGGLRLTHAEGDVEVADGVQKGIDLDVAGTFSGIPLESQLVIVERRRPAEGPLTGAWRELDVTQVPGAFFDLIEGRAGGAALGPGRRARGRRAGRRRRDVPAAGEDHGERSSRPSSATRRATSCVPVELWVGKEDSLIRRIEVTGPVEEGESDDVDAHGRPLRVSGRASRIERPAP